MSVLSLEQPLAPAPLPVLRLLPVPVSEPPFDDELPLHLVAPVAPRPIGPLHALSRLRLVPEPPLQDDDEQQVYTRTPVADLPSSRPVARALVQGLLEVHAGVRPLAQLRRWTTTELYARLELAVSDQSRAGGWRPTGSTVRSLHVQEQPEGVAEVCATVRRGSRAAAVALRLEGLDGRWCCTDLVGL